MKKLILIIFTATMLCACGSSSKTTKHVQRPLEVGQSRNIVWNEQMPALLRQAVKDGVHYIEFGMNDYLKLKMPRKELDANVDKTRQALKDSGMKVWSLHLPFSGKMDISVLDDKKRAENLRFIEEMIGVAATFNPRKVVLHPSSEPIKETDREQRMVNSISSIDYLRKVAARYKIQICVENLPRTCLGRNSDEMKRLVGQFPDVGICFDTNHLLSQSQVSFVQAVGDRICTLHVSDYDNVDERHWVPFEGVIDWKATYAELRKVGYDGVFMFETHHNSKDNSKKISPADIKAVYDKIHNL